MAHRVDVLWHCSVLSSAEHFSLHSVPSGWVLSGDVALPVDGVPGHASYRVTASRDWVVERTDIDFTIGERRESWHIEHADGMWAVNGQLRADLAGCSDVDLGWTPATNTIPLRRLNLEIGEHADIRAAWVRFPELDIQASDQRYVRVAAGEWRYQSGPYDFLLTVSEDGLIVEYGDDLWRADAVA